MDSLASLLFVSLAAFSGIAAAVNKTEPASVRSVAQSRPCRPAAAVSVIGYLHVSHHGSWISDDPGLNGKGLRIRFADFDSSGDKRLVNYLRRPQENTNNTFSAVFTGAIACNENGAPVLQVHEVEHIEVKPVRDAGAMPIERFRQAVALPG